MKQEQIEERIKSNSMLINGCGLTLVASSFLRNEQPDADKLEKSNNFLREFLGKANNALAREGSNFQKPLGVVLDFEKEEEEALALLRASHDLLDEDVLSTAQLLEQVGDGLMASMVTRTIKLYWHLADIFLIILEGDGMLARIS